MGMREDRLLEAAKDLLKKMAIAGASAYNPSLGGMLAGALMAANPDDVYNWRD